MYDAELSYTDEMIGRLFDHVRSLDLDDTVFVITADHGELFGEYGLLAHKLCLHDAVINVPLIVHGFDSIEADPDDMVQHADIIQTLVAQAGGITDGMQGVNLREEDRDYAIAQRGPARYEQFMKHNPNFDTSRYHDPLLTCLRTREFKYCKSDERTQLFDLPEEETDVSDDNPELTAEFDGTLESWLATEGQPIDSSADADFTAAMEQQLRDLGYVE
jgi:uncharacterized sulfatase